MSDDKLHDDEYEPRVHDLDDDLRLYWEDDQDPPGYDEKDARSKPSSARRLKVSAATSLVGACVSEDDIEPSARR
jgi:hypothetical protein